MSSFSKTDIAYMQMALALAAKGRGRTSPNPMVGAVLVQRGEAVGHGFHARAGEPHAEPIALAEAGERAAGSTLYVTLEPCAHFGRTPPCADALIDAGVVRVVAAMEDPNPAVRGKGFATLREAGIQVDVGCLEPDARRLNEAFIVFHELGRPFITLKWAMSFDGRTSHDSGQSRWISNDQSRQHGHRLRANHDAVMVGIGTVLSDDPMLSVRLTGYDGPQPRRVVVDGGLAIPTRARLLREREGGEVILITSPYAKPEMAEIFRGLGARIITVPSKRRLIDIRAGLSELAALGIQSVLVEGGRQLHTTLLALGLADKMISFISPKIIGGSQLRSPVEDLGLPNMNSALKLRGVKWQGFEDDICIEGYLRDI